MAKVSNYLYDQFVKWFDRTYGGRYSPPPNNENISNSQFYKYWVNTGTQEALGAFAQGRELPPMSSEAVTPTRWTPETAAMASQQQFISSLPAGAPIPTTEWAASVSAQSPTAEQETDTSEQGGATDATRRIFGYTPEEWLTYGRDVFELQNAQISEMNDIERWRYANRQLEQNQVANVNSQFLDQGLRQQAEEFETWRNRMLSNLQGPENAVARWFVQHKPNNYQQQLESQQIGRQISGNIERLGALESQRQADAIVNQVYGLTNTPSETAQQTQLQEDLGSDIDYLQQISDEQQKQQALLERGPETPDWLSQFVPGVGQYLGNKPLNVLTPSGQQLNRITPSQSEYVAGAVEFLGGRPWRDALAQAQMMLPKNPSRRTSWRPSTQGRV